jgi:hypothetical protein
MMNGERINQFTIFFVDFENEQSNGQATQGKSRLDFESTRSAGRLIEAIWMR